MTAAQFDPDSELQDNRLARLRSEVRGRQQSLIDHRLPLTGNDLHALYRASLVALRDAQPADPASSPGAF